MIHRAKVDWWIVAAIGGAAVVLLAVGGELIIAGIVQAKAGVLSGVGIVAGGMFTAWLVWGCYNTRYEITSSDLVIRFGPFAGRVALSAIVEVFPTHNPLSAPAPSLNRLRVNFRRRSGKMRFALISPSDREAFISDLAKAARHLTQGEPLHLRLKSATSSDDE